MKIAVAGIDFPLGKKPIADERLERLKEIVHSLKITPIQIEFVDADNLRDCDGVLCEGASKLDLVLSDLEIFETKLASEPENPLFTRCKESLEKEIILSEVPFEEADKKILSGLNLVTLKPIAFVKKGDLPSVPEITKLVFADCGFISFFTANEKELRAWQIKKQTTIYEAAGCIHSDLQRGFIKAEVVNYEDLVKAGSLNQAKAKGLVQLVDREYIVRDGDLVQIKFNV